MLSGKMRAKADMRCIYKTLLKRRTADILRNNEGASLVLVTIIAIIITTSVVILSVNVNTLITSADRQCYQDQAYEAARSMGVSLDQLINDHKIKLEDYCVEGDEDTVLIRDDSSGHVVVEARVERLGLDTYLLLVSATCSGEEYVYSATYSGSNKTYFRVN